MKKYIILLILISHVASAKDECMDIGALARIMPEPASNKSEIDKIIKFYNHHIRSIISYQLDREMNSTAVQLNQAPFKIKWKFDENGAVTASCDCEDILNSSKDIKEAQAVFKLLNSAMPLINKTKANFPISKSAQKLEYCATGKFQTSIDHSTTNSNQKKSKTTQ